MSDAVEKLAGVALAAITIASFSYAFVMAWRVLG